MERVQAEKRFNLEPIECPQCRVEQPNYRFLIMNTKEIRCFGCATASPQLVGSIHASLKEYYQDLIRRLPLPDYKVARACLESVGRVRVKAGELLGEIRAKIAAFEGELEGWLAQTEVTCLSYLEKVRQVEESRVDEWQRSPPKLIEQEKFIVNIKQKHRVACRIAATLHTLQVHIPSIEQVRKQALPAVTPICPKSSITAALNARGSLFLGAMDGQLFFEHDFQYKSIQAHDSLIRALEHDGQFRLFSGSDDSAIKMWDIRGEHPHLQRVFGSLEGIRSYHRQLNLLEGGRVLASSRGQFDAYRIRLWDLASFANVRTLQGHEGYIRSMLVDGRGRIVSASEDRTVKVWEGRSCELVRAYFHGSKILFLFAHAPTHSYCIIDDKNRALLLDQDALAVYHALYIGRKVVHAAAASFLYLHVDRYLLVYSWTLDLEERLDLGSTWASTNIIEMGTALLITDVHGNLHELHPAALARN